MSKAKLNKVPRFIPNPEENWGPKARAGSSNAKLQASNAKRKVTDGAGDKSEDNSEDGQGAAKQPKA
eukprot:1183621-Prorocentrum_minimum.AAC.1